VPDCCLGLRLDPTDHDAEAAGVLVVAPAALLHQGVPQPDGTLLYQLLSGHPDRAAYELVFVADLAVELRACPHGAWARLGVDPQAAAGAVIAAGRRLVGVAGPAAQRLGHPPLGHRARPGALGVLLDLLLTVGEPPGQPRRWLVGVTAGAGGAAGGAYLP
jgi:hypothetical protein